MLKDVESFKNPKSFRNVRHHIYRTTLLTTLFCIAFFYFTYKRFSSLPRWQDIQPLAESSKSTQDDFIAISSQATEDDIISSTEKVESPIQVQKVESESELSESERKQILSRLTSKAETLLKDIRADNSQKVHLYGNGQAFTDRSKVAAYIRQFSDIFFSDAATSVLSPLRSEFRSKSKSDEKINIMEDFYPTPSEEVTPQEDKDSVNRRRRDSIISRARKNGDTTVFKRDGAEIVDRCTMAMSMGQRLEGCSQLPHPADYIASMSNAQLEVVNARTILLGRRDDNLVAQKENEGRERLTKDDEQFADEQKKLEEDFVSGSIDEEQQLYYLLRSFERRLQKYIFPWLNPDIALTDLRNQAYGRGIVVAAADKFMKFLEGFLRVYRAVRSDLEIEFSYSGDESLSRDNRRKLSEIHPQLKFRDYSPYMSAFGRRQISGYAVKPFALLFATYREVILFDTDIAITGRPEDDIFAYPGYLETGMLLFRDRILSLPNAGTKFVHSLFNDTLLTDMTLKNRYMSGFQHFVESGVVAIDRFSHFKGLASTCEIVSWPETFNHMWGDKEAFWIGQSLVGNEKYHIYPLETAAIGSKQNEQTVVSAHPVQLHWKPGKQILWFNAGYTKCKYEASLSPPELDYIALYNGPGNDVWAATGACSGSGFTLRNDRGIIATQAKEKAYLFSLADHWRK